MTAQYILHLTPTELSMLSHQYQIYFSRNYSALLQLLHKDYWITHIHLSELEQSNATIISQVSK